MLPPNIIKIDFRLRKSTSPLHFSLLLLPSISPRVILSEGRSPQSNPEGVCVAQDLRGKNRISVRDPATSCRAPRSTPLHSAQDDTDGLNARLLCCMDLMQAGGASPSPTEFLLTNRRANKTKNKTHTPVAISLKIKVWGKKTF